MVTIAEFRDILNKFMYQYEKDILVEYENKLYGTHEVFSDTGLDICFKFGNTDCNVTVGELCTLIFVDSGIYKDAYFELLIDSYTTVKVNELIYDPVKSAIILKV